MLSYGISLAKHASYLLKIGICSGGVVEALRYELEGHGIDTRWCHWNFSLT
jgi:hypothetical protein